MTFEVGVIVIGVAVNAVFSEFDDRIISSSSLAVIIGGAADDDDVVVVSSSGTAPSLSAAIIIGKLKMTSRLLDSILLPDRRVENASHCSGTSAAIKQSGESIV